jgi:hypothetical protein
MENRDFGVITGLDDRIRGTLNYVQFQGEHSETVKTATKLTNILPVLLKNAYKILAAKQLQAT